MLPFLFCLVDLFAVVCFLSAFFGCLTPASITASSPVPQRKFPVEKAGASASEGIAAAVASSPAASSSSLGGRFDRDPAYAEFRTELFQLLSRLPDFCFDPSSVALPS